MGEHKEAPRGAASSHPLGYVQNSDPGAVGAFRPWTYTDDDNDPTAFQDLRVRNADNDAWISLAASIVVAAPVSSVFGRTGAIVAAEGDYGITQLSDVVIASAVGGHILIYNGSAWVNRVLVAGDIPSLDAAIITSGQFAVSRLAVGTPDGTQFIRDDGTLAVPAGTGAPTTVDYLVKTASASLSAERVVTNSTSITADWSVAGLVTFLRAALTGDVTASADSNATTIANDAVTTAKIIANAVTNARLAQMADQRIKGNVSGGTADPSDLTAAQVRTMLALVIGTNVEAWSAVLDLIAGLTPAADKAPYFTGGSSAALMTVSSFIRGLLDDADAATARATLGVDGSGSGTVADGSITLAKLADLAQDQFIGRTSASTGVPQTATITAAARTVLDDTTVANMLATLLGAPLASPTFTGSPAVPDDAYDATTWNGSAVIPTKNAIRDKIEAILAGVTFTGAISVPDDAYDATAWNGSVVVPTKNALRDQIVLLATLASPTFTGVVTLPSGTVVTTQSAGNNTTAPASTAFVKTALDAQAECIIVAVTDETTAITTGDAKITFHFPFAFTVSSVSAGLSTVSSSGAVTVDVNEAGSTIFSTKITIDQSEDHTSTAATPSVLSDTAIAAFAKMTVDIDGAGTGAKGLKLYFYGVRA